MLKRRETTLFPKAPARGAEIAPEDWDVLFRAVQDRLRAALDSLPGAHDGAELQAAQALVNDCVAALGGLHAAAMRRFGQHRRSGSAAPANEEVAVPLVALCVHLEGLQPVDDAHGPALGAALRGIAAARLARTTRASDLVLPLGNDSFVCLLADTPGRSRLGQLACALFDAGAAPYRLGALTLVLRPSIGIALRADESADTRALLRNANLAMQRARETQTGHAFFEPPADG